MLVYLLSKTDKSYSTSKIVLESSMQVQDIINHYKATLDDLKQLPA